MEECEKGLDIFPTMAMVTCVCIHSHRSSSLDSCLPREMAEDMVPPDALYQLLSLVVVIKYLISATKDGRVDLGSLCEGSVRRGGEVTRGHMHDQQAE